MVLKLLMCAFSERLEVEAVVAVKALALNALEDMCL